MDPSLAAPVLILYFFHTDFGIQIAPSHLQNPTFFLNKFPRYLVFTFIFALSSHSYCLLPFHQLHHKLTFTINAPTLTTESQPLRPMGTYVPPSLAPPSNKNRQNSNPPHLSPSVWTHLKSKYWKVRSSQTYLLIQVF